MKKWSRKYDACKDENCKTPHARYKARGYCVNCYLRWRYKQSPAIRAKWRQYNKSYRKRHPEKFVSKVSNPNWPSKSPERMRQYQIKSQYGIEALRAWLRKPEYCEVPGCKNPAEVIDHDHASGEFRGILCHLCNKALVHGIAAEVHAGRAKYLRKHQ